MTLNIKKFRTPMKCQNGHFRWMYHELYRGEIKMYWGEKNCSCPTDGIDQGFESIGSSQQFLDLHDVNQKEMWEGDITKADSLTGRPSCEIVLHEGAFCLRGKVNGVEATSLLWNKSRAEIIGSVYENPELLIPYEEKP